MVREEEIRLGLLYSLTGTTGVTERGQYQATLLAIKHINELGGIHGKRLLPIVEDIASDPFLAAKKAEKLILSDKVSVIIGLYTSVCRKMVIPILEKYNILLLYPTLYEGEELSQNVFYCGPVPNQQLEYFIPWIIENLGKSFYLIGSDYIYPRETNRHIHRLVQTHGGHIAGEFYSPLGTQKFENPLREIIRLDPDVVFSTLVGDSLMAFYQQFYHSGIHKPIASPITAETEIHAMNTTYAVGHYASFPYFDSIGTEQNNRFVTEYKRTYGADTISSVMENAYNSVFLLAEAIRKAKAVDTQSIRRALAGITFEAPQGKIRMDEKNQHLWLHSRIGRVNEKGRFDIVWESDGLIPPVPFSEQTFLYENECYGAANVITPNELQAAQNRYKPLIEKLKSATRLFSYTFAVFDNNGILLESFKNEKFGDPENLSLLIPGIHWPSLVGQSGITLALSGHTSAVVYEADHDMEELHDRISIGIPIKGNIGSLQGVLGIFLKPDHVDEDCIDVLVQSISQIVECCVEIVEQAEKHKFAEQLSLDISKFVSESFLVVENGKILFSNDTAKRLLSKHKIPVQDIVSGLNTRIESEMLVRRKIQGELFEIRIVPAEKYRYIFVKRIRPENDSPPKSTQILIKDIIGSNERFLKTIQLAKLASNVDANVLLLGESGTGKELFARAIHNESPRKQNPFIAINCGALSRELIHAELFGYVEGAFTGAKKGGNPGKFEIANGGTLFLDEIGEMPLELQAALLRVLQEREVVRIGGSKPIPIDVRIIAATNKNLNDEIAYNGSFRSDLYYRLNVFTIELIPLRERTEDIPELTSYFIEQLNETGGFPPKTITEETLELLVKHSWPGNVRELKNVVERSYYLAGNSSVITPDHLPAGIVYRETAMTASAAARSPLQNTLEEFKKIGNQIEKGELKDLLVKYRGNISKVAKHLGISRTTLYRKLKTYQLL